MPKRKAVASPESEEDTPPKTARQKREEAKARAREWAEREAAGLNKKKTSATRNSAGRTPPRKRATATKKTPTRKSTTPKKKESPIKSPEPAKKKQKLNSGTAKLSKKQQIAEAKARAQEWADKQKEVDAKRAATSSSKTKKPAAKKSPAKVPTPKPAEEQKADHSAAADEQAPAARRYAGPYSAALGPDGNLSNNGGGTTTQAQIDMMRAQEQQAMARAQAENAWAARMQQQMGSPAAAAMSPQQRYHEQVMQNAAMAMYGQQPWGAYPPAAYNYGSPSMNAPVASPPNGPMVLPQQQGHLRGTTQPVAPANAASYLGSPPPINAPPAAAAKAKSPTRPRRAAATKKTTTKKAAAPAVSPPAEIPAEEGDVIPVVEQEDVEVEGTGASKGFRFLPVSLKALIIPVVVAIGAYFAFLHPGSGALKSVKPSEPVKPPCFLSDPDKAQALFNCDRDKGILHCPEGGVCSRGQLTSCIDPYMAVAETLDQCVPSSETNATLADVEALLTEWTVEQTCSLAGAAHPINSPDTRAPFFDVSLIKEQLDVDESMLSLSDSFVVVSGNDESLIGFTDDYVDNKLVVPFWCYCGLLAFGTLEMILSIMFYVGTLVTEVFFNMTMAFPLATGGLLVSLWTVWTIRKKRNERKQLRHDVATVRELTYGKLIEDVKVEHFVIHLRDGVAMDLYPTSKTKRTYIINKVWPRVVADVKQDNRVLKSTKMLLGTPRDIWQWTAKATPGKKN